ncbi:DUF1080 domain-containing protein [Blastopirellula sp. J2-11]|uniref:3-keto-disaccharide hydrolase n=1 Tax=Blastopirellula sp. J2-11 TaxID=2943192 RepID=UPI0021C900D8|nr:DUF1080 domain-containing protein [Blastopirellula sp. J2-11]UUO07123.1 DUF1080 domain-containing protein [Blastopirellula sp. J2-11]
MSVYRLCAFIVLLVGLPTSLVSAEETSPAAAKPITPTETISLLGQGDLSQHFYTWLTDGGYEDPRHVFTMGKDGILKISGDGFGGLITHQEYADYYLVLEYRWGTETLLTRKGRARDGGLLLHCQGPDGGFGGSATKPGPWMTSIECQIIEGGVGDILVLAGKDAAGKPLKASATCTIVRDRDGEAVWSPTGEATTFPKGRINWFGRDPNWKDVVDFRGPDDVESPGQEWTKLECFCVGDKLVYRVNGVVVNRASNVIPRQGKILLQTEGAEMYVRKAEIGPLPKEIP